MNQMGELVIKFKKTLEDSFPTMQVILFDERKTSIQAMEIMFKSECENHSEETNQQ